MQGWNWIDETFPLPINWKLGYVYIFYSANEEYNSYYNKSDNSI